ncbi:MAG TPA: transposase [Thermoanaerobaculia bacterium]|nr:transposase [Thermoanaerobaculia bacterium]
MARDPRFQPPGYLMEVTCRTVQGRYLLRPGERLNAIVLGVLGRAQRLFGLRIHGFVFLSNHYHLLVSPTSVQQLAQFMGYLNGNLAKEVGRLARWKDKVWARRYQAIPVSHEEAAQIGRLRYLLAHGCKERLVPSPTDWPGAHCVDTLLEGATAQGTWIDRSAEYEARRRGKKVDTQAFCTLENVVLEPLPCWVDLPEEVRRCRVRELVQEIKLDGQLAAGPGLDADRARRRILLQHPHSRPKTPPPRRPTPKVHAASATARQAFWQALRAFVRAYREAASRLREGDRLACFPEGCFPPALPFVPAPSG